MTRTLLQIVIDGKALGKSIPDIKVHERLAEILFFGGEIP